MINPEIESIVREFKQALLALYGERLHDVILTYQFVGKNAGRGF